MSREFSTGQSSQKKCLLYTFKSKFPGAAGNFMNSQLKLVESNIFEKRILEKDDLRLAQYQAAMKNPSNARPKQNRVKRVSFGFR